jgi:hypothetical protein
MSYKSNSNARRNSLFYAFACGITLITCVLATLANPLLGMMLLFIWMLDLCDFKKPQTAQALPRRSNRFVHPLMR